MLRDRGFVLPVECGRRWKRNEGDGSLGDVSDVSPFRPLLKIRATVRSGAESLGVRDVKRIAIEADGQASGKPCRGEIPENFSLPGIEHGDGVNARAGDVKPL